MRLHAGMRVGIVQAFNLGDVIACLPMAGLIKQAQPQARVVLIARRYAQPVAEACIHIDEFLDADACQQDAAVLKAARLDVLVNPFPHREIAESAYRARVPLRIGNLRRGAYARWCNRFVFYGRRGTDQHEAQLNLRDLRPLGIRAPEAREQLAPLMGLSRPQPLSSEHAALLESARFNLLLHPRSNGNAREWPLAHYHALVRLLPERFKVFLCGTEADGRYVGENHPALLQEPEVTALFGRFTLPQYLAFIHAADGMVAASTGPLHLAAAMGRHALGIYPSREGLNIKRWGPIGAHAQALQLAPSCTIGGGGCGRHHGGGACACTEQIMPAQVLNALTAWSKH